MLKIRLIVFTIFLSFLSYIYYANEALIEISTNVEGEIIPFGKIRKVQNLEGGIIKNINIKEGMVVKKGEVLLELEKVISKSEIGEIKSRLAFLQSEMIFYKSILDNKKPIIDKNLKKNFFEIFNSSKLQYLSKITLFDSEIKIKKEKIFNLKKSLKLLKNKRDERLNSSKIIDKQIEISKDLLKENITSELKHLDLLKEKQYLITQISDTTKNIDAIKNEISINYSGLEVFKNNFLAQVSEKYHLFVEDKYKYINRLKRYEDTLFRKIIKSPISGIIKELHVFTNGAVVQPGQEILSIVPQDELLIVQAKLPVKDIGYIEINQNVIIRLKGNEGFAFSSMKGKISLISPDTKLNDKGEAYYIIQMKTSSKQFVNKTNIYKLYPGLTVDCNIIIGQRSVLQNILIPFLNFNDLAFKENVWFSK